MKTFVTGPFSFELMGATAGDLLALDLTRTWLERAGRAHDVALAPPLAEVETLIARMDAVLTTRLHGTVLALKNEVPVLAIDPVAGGATNQRQVETIDWPILFTANVLDDANMRTALCYCPMPEARARAAECRERAARWVAGIRDEVIAALTTAESRGRI